MSVARTFLEGIVDYAGLFPPAKLSMSDAVAEYAKHMCGDDRDLLGRFILPASRLPEFAKALGSSSSTSESKPWQLSVTTTAGDEADAAHVMHFNAWNSDSGNMRGAVVHGVEIPVKNAAEINWALTTYPESLELFLEVANGNDSSALLKRVAGTRASAKIRTGGIVTGSIPSATAVMDFIDACSQLGLRFKATAGLHHALRGLYPLTYEADAPRDTMFGYLNVFLAAAFHRAGLAKSELPGLLEECDPSSIAFDDDGVRWRDNFATTAQLMTTRNSLAVSFGSCSFTEPVSEARRLHLL